MALDPNFVRYCESFGGVPDDLTDRKRLCDAFIAYRAAAAQLLPRNARISKYSVFVPAVGSRVDEVKITARCFRFAAIKITEAEIEGHLGLELEIVSSKGTDPRVALSKMVTYLDGRVTWQHDQRGWVQLV
jgi:hypothetical protein